MKGATKAIGEMAASLLTLPLAVCAGFGRFGTGFQFGTHCVAFIPGLPGDYLRTGYYRWTLHSFGSNSRIQFGSYFAHPDARVANGVYIGSYCVLGKVEIGDRSQIASGVQILSGRRQHARDEAGGIQGSETGAFAQVRIGSDCWIGAGAIVMADVGEGTTVGAGSVVVNELPARCTAVGNPARIVQPTSANAGSSESEE
jgi:virginiamycin A acetyltransferase